MKIKEFMIENFQTVSINGILYSLNTDEKKIYSKVKEAGKLLKSELNEFDQRIASSMVTKGLLCRRKNPQHEIYFTTKGRRKCAINKPVEEVAPPDSQIEKWINDNKERFQNRYGKDYKKYLYGKAWNKFNGKKITESFDFPKGDMKELPEYLYIQCIPHAQIGDEVKKLFDNDNIIYQVVDIKKIPFLYNNKLYYQPMYSLQNMHTGHILKEINNNYFQVNFYVVSQDDYWDGEDEETLNESKQISKYSKGQKLYNINTQEECTITDIHFEPGLGFFYTVEFDKGYNEDHIHQTLSFNVSEKHLNEEYSENLDYWDGEDE